MLSPRIRTVEVRRRGAPAPSESQAPRTLARIHLTPEQAAALKRMVALRKALLHTVHKSKFRCFHKKYGHFDLWLEDGDTLPVVIDGEAGKFISGHWIPLSELPTQEPAHDPAHRSPYWTKP